MKSVTFCLVCLLGPALCFAQETSNDTSLGYDLDAYTTTWGGWYVNQQCEWLDADGVDEFARDLEAIDQAMQREIPNTSMLAALKSSVESTVAHPPYSDCQEKSIGIIKDTSRHARNWAIQIQSEDL